jgi:hypothetical protein
MTGLLVATLLTAGCGASEQAADQVTDPAPEHSTGAPGSPVAEAPAPRDASQPDPGVAVGEPNPGAPDCPECTPVASSTAAPAPPPASGPSHDDGLTQPRPGQANVRARRWESAAVHDDDVTIDVTYYSGVEPCSVLDHVEVAEEAARVVITLYEGSRPGFDGACTQQAVQRTTRIRLAAPLRTRALVDGSDPA